jgi:hypothetical protein
LVQVEAAKNRHSFTIHNIFGQILQNHRAKGKNSPLHHQKHFEEMDGGEKK